jgi:hypothetical protein
VSDRACPGLDPGVVAGALAVGYCGLTVETKRITIRRTIFFHESNGVIYFNTFFAMKK